MATVGACIFSTDLSPAFCRDTTSSSSGKPKRNPINVKRVLAVSTEQSSTATTVNIKTASTRRGFVEKKRREEADDETRQRVNDVEESGESERKSKSLKDYFDEAKEMIRSSSSDGGAPRWFSPTECGSHTHDYPLLLYLPGT